MKITRHHDLLFVALMPQHFSEKQGENQILEPKKALNVTSSFIFRRKEYRDKKGEVSQLQIKSSLKVGFLILVKAKFNCTKLHYGQAENTAQVPSSESLQDHVNMRF